MEYVELNVKRLEHIMALYRVSKDELLSKLNGKKNKTILTKKDVFQSYIKLSLLKKIDKIFEKGLTYYIDPKPPISSKEESIFFRKEDFNVELSLGAKQVVNRFEQEKLSFSALSKLTDSEFPRRLPVYTLIDKPEVVAKEVRKLLYPNFSSFPIKFLKNFIGKLAEHNILVFEFVEPHNKTEKANINGIFLTPNFIVLKNTKPYSREIFTLTHELGHYLLNKEDIDSNANTIDINYKMSDTERWCNDFSFCFLAGDLSKEINGLDEASPRNDYHNDVLNKISLSTHLSKSALYTRLLIKDKISPLNYKKTIDSIREKYEKDELERKEKRDLEKQQAKAEGREIKIPTVKPIISPLYLNTLQIALYSGIITEWDFCKRLNVAPKTLDKYLI